jgi:hypothetical protein
MIDASAEARAARLRRLAAIEIAAHAREHGLLGAALDGSLATNSVWPTSDLDFTIVPLPDDTVQHWVEWGEREGMVWHKHLNRSQVLHELKANYPQSFIQTSREAGILEDKWLLDGLAVMEIVQDPEGVLGDIQAFVAAHRFAPEVWDGRRELLRRELRLARDRCAEQIENGQAEEACQAFRNSFNGFAAMAGHLWLEAAQRIFSSKEQDGLLAEVMHRRGQGEAHAWYRDILGVHPERAAAAAPLILELGQQAAALYARLDASTLSPEQRKTCCISAAWITHLSETLSIAPRQGHPATIYQQLDSLLYWTQQRPRNLSKKYGGDEASGKEEWEAAACTVERAADVVRETLIGPLTAEERARNSLAAADKLLALSERVL